MKQKYAACEECRQLINPSDLVGGTKRVEPPNECPDCGSDVSGPYTVRE